MFKGYAPISRTLEFGPFLELYPNEYSSLPTTTVPARTTVDLGLNIPSSKTRGISHAICSVLLQWALYTQLNENQSL